MKKKDILNAHYLLNGDQSKGIAPVDFSNLQSKKVSYAKFKNMPKIRTEAEAIEATIREIASVRYRELKDEIVKNVTPLNKDAETKEAAQAIENKWLRSWANLEEWKEESAKYKKLVEEFVEEESELELHKVQYDDVPETINDLQFEAISIFIQD